MGLTEFFFDTYALIEVLRKNPSYENFADKRIRISLLNLLELTYIIINNHSATEARSVFSKFKRFVVETPDEVVIQSMIFRAMHKKRNLSYADCLGYSLAIHFGLTFLTGDEAFRDMPHVEFVK